MEEEELLINDENRPDILESEVRAKKCIKGKKELKIMTYQSYC